MDPFSNNYLFRVVPFVLTLLLTISVTTLAMTDRPISMKNVYLMAKDHKDLVNVIPDEMATSLPVPVPVQMQGGVDEPKQFVFFHYYMTRNNTKGPGISNISSPRQKTIFNYPELSIVKTEKTTSKAFGVSWDDSKPVGQYTPDPNISYEQIVKRRDRFFELYDLILPEYIARTPSLSANAKQKIQEFNKLFSTVGFSSLMPYYKSINPDFFQWLDQNSR